MYYSFDTRRDLVILTEDKVIPFLAEYFFHLYEKCVGEKGFFTVGLSGGSTPKKLYAYIAEHPLSKRISPSKIHLFWGDERAVSPDHPDSNYHMAMEAGFAKWHIPSANIHRMHAEKEMEKGAKAYEEELKKVLGDEGLDLIFLGMGDDGHTASLFPNTAALQEKESLVVANFVEEKKTYRMTMTFPFINRCKNIVFFVLGKNKETMIDRLFSPLGKNLPSYKIGTKEHRALWVLDDAAASLLKNKLKK